MVSVGGNYDKQKIIVWNLKTGKPAFSKNIGYTNVNEIMFMNNNSEKLVMATDKKV